MSSPLRNLVDKRQSASSQDLSPRNNAQASTPQARSIFKGLNLSSKSLKESPCSCPPERKAHHAHLLAIRPIRDGLGLPVELWLEIFQHILTPQFALMRDALSYDIQSFYTAVTLHSLTNPEMQGCKRFGANLRLVCRAWKLAIDYINTQKPNSARNAWIKKFEINKAFEYGPCLQFDTHLQNLNELREVHQKKKYQHAVDIIRLHVRTLDHQTLDGCPDLRYLLAKPWTLTALHISFIICEYDVVFPTKIIQNLSSLRTLSIASSSGFELCGPFTLPFLTTLFLTFLSSPYHDVLSQLGEWRFPNLHTLSVDARGWPHPTGVYKPDIRYTDELGLGVFLRKHKGTLRSIRIIPFSLIPFQSGDMVCTDPSLAPESPALETLVTNIVREVPWIHYKNRPERLLLSKIKHLVHIFTGVRNQADFARRLLESLKALPSVETISLLEEPPVNKRARYVQNKSGLQELQNLDIYCRNKGIRVYGDMGSEFCCVESAWKQIIRNKVREH